MALVVCISDENNSAPSEDYKESGRAVIFALCLH